MEKDFFYHICLSSLVFIRSIRGSAPFKVLELCIIWIRIGVENMVTCSCATLLLASRTKTSSKGLHPVLSLSPALAWGQFTLRLSVWVLHLGWLDFSSAHRQTKLSRASRASVCVCVCLMWYELIDDELLVVYTTTLSRTGTETETARTQVRKSSRG